MCANGAQKLEGLEIRCRGRTSPQSECAPAIAFIDDLIKMCANSAQKLEGLEMRCPRRTSPQSKCARIAHKS